VDLSKSRARTIKAR